MELISSRNNQYVKRALKLKSKKYRDQYGEFLMEGLRSAEDAAKQGTTRCICFITEAALSEERAARVIGQGEALHWLVLVVEEELMKLLSGTEHSQGVLLVVQKPKHAPEELLRPLHGFYVLLDSVQDPGNMGTILRTAAAAGAKAVLLTKGCTDVYAEKAVRSSMGSILRIPVYENLDLPFIEKLKETSGLLLYGTALQNAVPYKTVGSLTGGIFIFGNEGNGMRPELLAMTDKNLYIPLAHQVESLNVSTACAVILFHFIDSGGAAL